MPQFDVYRAGAAAYALDCQSDNLPHLTSRLTVPLVRVEDAPPPIATLNPILTVAGQPCSMLTQFAGAVSGRSLGEPIASLAQHRLAIQAALDMLTGSY